MMARILEKLAVMGNNTAFHVYTMALLVTCALVLMTAPELGPVAAFLIPLALYGAIFVVLAEVFFFVRYGLAVFARRRNQK